MTIEFRTDSTGGIMTPVRILNMGSGFAYGDVITVPDTALGVAAPGTGNITFTGASNGHNYYRCRHY